MLFALDIQAIARIILHTLWREPTLDDEKMCQGLYRELLISNQRLKESDFIKYYNFFYFFYGFMRQMLLLSKRPPLSAEEAQMQINVLRDHIKALKTNDDSAQNNLHQLFIDCFRGEDLRILECLRSDAPESFNSRIAPMAFAIKNAQLKPSELIRNLLYRKEV